MDGKIQAHKLRELREIDRLEKTAKKLNSKRKGYLWYLVLIICVVYLADEIASQINSQMQSVVASQLFAPVFGADVAVARMSALSTISMVMIALSFFYKPLSDRFGRKPFLVINTLGMGIGLLIISISTNIPVYIMGACVAAFFVPHDVQQVYVLESMPQKSRATWYAIIKAVATVGIMLIPVLRQLIMGTDPAKWHFVYLVPGIIAVAIAVISIFAVKETEPYVKRRLEYLYMSDEEREALNHQKVPENSQGGIISALKYCFMNKQLRWLMIGGGFVTWGLIMTQFYETVLSNGYSTQFIDLGMSVEMSRAEAMPFVTQALLMFPIGSAIIQLIQGFISDRLGRKPAATIMCISSVTMYVLFFFGSKQGWNPYLIGLFCGGAIGGYWAAQDTTGGVMCSESTPTNIRSSVMAVQPILTGVFSGIILFAGIALVNVFGDAHAGLISLCGAVPGMVIGLLIIASKVKETKNVSLDEVTGSE